MKQMLLRVSNTTLFIKIHRKFLFVANAICGFVQTKRFIELIRDESKIT